MERRSALSRMIHEQGEYILPVRFDDTPVPGLPTDVIYERGSEHTPAQLSAMIANKLGIWPFDGKASQVPPPSMTSRPARSHLITAATTDAMSSGLECWNSKRSGQRRATPVFTCTMTPQSINGVTLAPEIHVDLASN